MKLHLQGYIAASDELKWDRLKDKIYTRFKRKSFFNYRFLLSKLIPIVGIKYRGKLPEIKTKPLRLKQNQIYDLVCKEIDFSEFKLKQQ
jgi:hypothetical protein